MANPTTNYGFVLPTSSDLVTDLPADFDVALQGVDTRLKALQPGTTLGDLAYSSATANTNTRLPIGTNGQVLGVSGGVPAWVTDASGMTNPMTSVGDLIRGGTSGAPTRVAIGSTGQVLTVSGGVPAWGAAPTSTTSYTLINTGGTALTGAATITISGLSGYNKLMIYVQAASDNSGGGGVYCWFNGDQTTKYGYYGARFDWQSSYASANYQGTGGTGADKLLFGGMSGTAASAVSGYIQVDAANSTGRKVINYVAAGNQPSSSGHKYDILGAYYDGTSVISSFSIFADSGNFDAGTVFIYGGN